MMDVNKLIVMIIPELTLVKSLCCRLYTVLCINHILIKLYTSETLDPSVLRRKFYQIQKEIPLSLRPLQRIGKEAVFVTLFYEANKTLLPKGDNKCNRSKKI